jgi:hypothetical protein
VHDIAVAITHAHELQITERAGACRQLVKCGSTLRDTASHCHNVVRACKISGIQRGCALQPVSTVQKMAKAQGRVFRLASCKLHARMLFDTLPELPSSNSNHAEPPGLQHTVW